MKRTPDQAATSEKKLLKGDLDKILIYENFIIVHTNNSHKKKDCLEKVKMVIKYKTLIN